MKMANIPDPVIMGPDQLIIEVQAAGVNPVDAYIRSGRYPMRMPLPYTPGWDGAGTVLSTGPGVKKFKPGDRVYFSGSLTGAYAEKTLCEENQAHLLPSNLSFPQGAAVGVPYGTAWRALFIRAKARPAETVLIHGASGGVGTAAVQIARTAGIRVIGTAGTEQGRRLVSALGANFVLDHTDPGHMRKVLELTEGRGADVILEFLANINLSGDIETMAAGGRVVVVGSRGKIEIDPGLMMGNDGSVLGMSLRNAPPQENAEIYAAIGAGLANGLLSPVIDKELPLSAAPLAHEAVMKAGAHGKTVLMPYVPALPERELEAAGAGRR